MQIDSAHHSDKVMHNTMIKQFKIAFPYLLGYLRTISEVFSLAC